MSAKIPKELTDVHQNVRDYFLHHVPVSEMELDSFIADNICGFGTTKDELVLNIKELRDLLTAQSEQDENLDSTFEHRPVHSTFSDSENQAIIIEDLIVTVDLDDSQMVVEARVSWVYGLLDASWKLVHFHASVPSDTEGDFFHVSEWQREKEKLEQKVAKQTADLQHKNRKLEIEAALERVRSRTMAMQSSDELADVGLVLFQQIEQAIGFEPESSWITFINPDKNTLEVWVTHDDKFVEPKTVSARDHKNYEQEIAAWNSGEKSIQITLPKEDFIQTVKKNFGMEVSDKKEYSDFHVLNVRHKYGFLGIGAWNLVSDENIKIYQRFAKVFEQTYTRFLDLQKAEAQSREAQIEAALERVRARSMGMHKSDELIEVVREIGKGINDLGIDTHYSQIFTDYSNDPNDGLNIWVDVEGQNYLKRFYIPNILHPVTDTFNQALDAGKDFFSDTYSKSEKDSYFKLIFKHSDLKRISEKRKEFILDAPGWIRSTVILDESCLHFGRWNFDDFTDEEKKIFRRFGKVFGQAYTRFLDLRKAEAQAREAKIEAALERLRARSMGMHHSTELIEVVRLLDLEIKGLGIQNVDATQITTDLSDPDEGVNVWVKVEEMDYLKKFHVPYIDHPVISNLFEALKKKEKFYTEEYSEAEKNRFFRLLFKYSDFKSIPKERQTVLLNSPGLVRSSVIHKNSALIFQHNGLDKFSKEDNSIFKRFGVVFEQAYTRFLDLQKAEAQAAEAIKQASLDRVRGEIASMRSTNDLQNITPLIWNELKTLDVSFIRCGVFIIREDEQQIEVYLSKPNGTSLAVMHLPFDSNELAADTLEAWRNREVFTQRWSQQEFLDFGKGLMEQEQISDLESYQGAEEAPESLYLHFIPFNQGMLYVGSTGALDDEEISLSESLAKAFSIAYARYEDFVKLEKAKAGIEDALAELKATQSQLIQQEKLASLGQLTAGIAHEIKNPLNFVNNFSDLSVELVQETKDELSAISDQLSVEDRERVDEAFEILNDIEVNLKKVHEHGSRADSIVKSMLEHSRGGSGKPEPTDLNSLVKEFVNLSFHGMRAGKNPINVDMKFELDEKIEEVPLVAEDFSRAIVNLCNNAFDAMRGKLNSESRIQFSEEYTPKLTIRTQKDNSGITLEIEDNGPGIPEDIKDKILQPFFTTKKGTEGTGLGLSITNDIIKAHGGTLEIETDPDIGSKFIITL